jgi:hypothetical protein
MQFTLALAAIFAGVAFAAPAQLEDRQVPYTPCTGLYGTSQCCATDVLGLADLDCANRKSLLLFLEAPFSDTEQSSNICRQPLPSPPVPPTSQASAQTSDSAPAAAPSPS